MSITNLLESRKLDVRQPLLSWTAQELAYRRLECPADEVHRDSEPGVQPSPLYAIRFCNARRHSHLLALVNEDGMVRLHDTRPRHCGGRGQIDAFLAHYNAVFDFAWTEDDSKLVTASGDHSAVLWDISGTFTPLVRMVGHQGSVRSVACKPSEPSIFATGGRDGAVIQWDIRSKPIRTSVSDEESFKSVKIDKIIKSAHSRNPALNPRLKEPQSVSSVAYRNENSLISSSSVDRCIKIWDTRKTYSAFKGVPVPWHVLDRGPDGSNLRSGYVSLAVGPCRQKLYALCTDSHVYCFNVIGCSSEPVVIYKSNSYDCSFFSKLSLSPDGRFLAAGSTEQFAKIWSTAKPDGPLVTLGGHQEEVTCVDWCKQGEPKMATCSDDGTYRLWTIGPECDGAATRAEVQDRRPAPESKRYFACHCSIESRRRPRPLRGLQSPRKPLASPRKLEAALSTLPNLVIEGRSPHTPAPIASQSQRNPSDWLRKLIASTPPPSTEAKSPAASGKKRKTPLRAKRQSARGSLLKYFKKTGEEETDGEARRGAEGEARGGADVEALGDTDRVARGDADGVARGDADGVARGDTNVASGDTGGKVRGDKDSVREISSRKSSRKRRRDDR